jgi:hypothetical protein
MFATETWAGKTIGVSPDLQTSTTGAVVYFNSARTSVQTAPAGGPNPQALKFAYEDFATTRAEQRFDLHANYSDIWIEYWIYIPTNYETIDRNPGSGNDFGGGEKEWVLYSEDYSSTYPTVILGRNFKRHGANSGDGRAWQTGNISWVNTLGDIEHYGIPNAAWDSVECLIDPAVDCGTWQKRLLHFKFATGPTANNGICEYWITKRGTTYKIVDVQDGPWYGANAGSTGGNYINMGYMLGESDSGFNAATDFYIGGVRWSATNDFSGGGGGSSGHRRSPFLDFSARFR